MVFTGNHKTALNYPSSVNRFEIPYDVAPYGACVVVLKGDKILACSRKGQYDDLGLPGGKVDSGETSFQSAVRELWEETGLAIKDMDAVELFIAKNLQPYVLSGHKEVHTYFIPFEFLEGDLIEKNEVEDYICVWVSPDEICKDSCSFGEYNKKLVNFLESRDIIAKNLNLDKTKESMIEIIKNLNIPNDIPKHAEQRFSQGEILYTSKGFAVIVEDVESLGGDRMDYWNKKGFCKVIEVYGENPLGFNVGDHVVIQIPYKIGVVCSIHTLDDKYIENCYLFPTKNSAENADKIMGDLDKFKQLFDVFSWIGDLDIDPEYRTMLNEI